MALFHALIRTHHITSRKKIAQLRKAANKHECYALLRSGGYPGIMYCKGSEQGVREWVAAVQQLRYKDFQLAVRPELIGSEVAQSEEQPRLVEVPSVNDFAAAMKERGLSAWWERAMGFS
ncbi:hypothetical protein VTK56DRAFT_9449 [Thermocarpiscus australiensis]